MEDLNRKSMMFWMIELIGVYKGSKGTLSTEQKSMLRKLGSAVISEIQNPIQDMQYIEKISLLAELYANGYDVEWSVLQHRSGGRRIPMPTYPFERESYWIYPEDEENESKNALNCMTKTGEIRISAAGQEPESIKAAALEYLKE